MSTNTASDTPDVDIQFGMNVLDVRDLSRSIAFYRLLGLDVPDPAPDRPVVLAPVGKGVKMVIGEGIFVRGDAGWTRPDAGYQQMMEFVVGDDAAVDERWATLTAAGHRGRTAPARTFGAYSATVDDPDGNAVLISSDVATLRASG